MLPCVEIGNPRRRLLKLVLQFTERHLPRILQLKIIHDQPRVGMDAQVRQGFGDCREDRPGSFGISHILHRDIAATVALEFKCWSARNSNSA
jgi:hypothetical protein